MTFRLTVLALLAGCGDNPADFDVPPVGDDTGGADCVPTTEVCDGVDNDCDGLADEADAVGATDWFADADGDGHGAADQLSRACDQPDGFVSDATDCDDADPSVHPGATDDWYDGVDSDCDGGDDYDADGDGVDAVDWGADCDDTDPSVHPGAADSWYDGVDADCDGADDFDADADGHASADFGGSDCDDTLATVNPDATEVCGDGIDNDCDGGAPACALSGDHYSNTGDAMLTGEGSYDMAGFSMGAPGDVDGDGAPDILVGAPLAGAISDVTDGARAYLIYDAVSGVSSLSGADAVIVDFETCGETTAWDMAGAGDIDGDGYADVLVGACGHVGADGRSVTGAAQVFFGPLFGEVDADSADLTVLGETEGDMAGAAVAGAGDVDGDGHADFLVGAPGWQVSGKALGAAYLVSGPLSGEQSLEDAAARVAAEGAGQLAGDTVAGVGDLNGDGFDDIGVSAPLYGDGTLERSGAAYVLLGPIEGEGELADAELVFHGDTYWQYLGWPVAGAGDLDGDGYPDVALGATGDMDSVMSEGAVTIVRGGTDMSSDLSDALAVLYGGSAFAEVGTDVASAGDVDGDGRDDLLVGAMNADPSRADDAGTAYLVYGPVSGTGTLSAADARFLGIDYYQEVGSRVVGPGDLDADGYDDILIGARGVNGTARIGGAAIVFYGVGM